MQRNSFDKCVLTNDLRKRIWFDSNCQFSLSWVTKAESCFVSGTPIQYCIVSSLANHIRSRIFYTIISFFFFFFFCSAVPNAHGVHRSYAALLFQFYQSTFRRKRKTFISRRTVCVFFVFFCFVASLWLTIYNFRSVSGLSLERHNNNIYWTTRQIYLKKKSEKTKWFLSFHFFFFFNGYVCCVRCGRE